VTLPRLHAIVDADLAAAHGWSVPALGRAYLAGGARWLQLRAKHAASGQLLDWSEELVADAHAAGALIVVNDRADVARMSGADGAHIGQDDMTPPAAHAVLGDGAMLGLSTHTPAQIQAAVEEPVSYIAIGPVFGSSTKETGYHAVGLDMVRTAASARAGRGGNALPVVAIGGITLERATAVIDSGAASVAVIGDLLCDGDPERRVRAYVERLGG
jgi:thiamine-phosphate pyrophosphorylase